MPAEVVDRLGIRGRFAAQRLVARFGPTGDGWTNHRWLRFRSATAALSDWFADFEKGHSAPAPHFYDALLNARRQMVPARNRVKPRKRTGHQTRLHGSALSHVEAAASGDDRGPIRSRDC
jgi:hypothetical protein